MVKGKNTILKKCNFMWNSQIFLNVMFPFGHRVVSVKNTETYKVLRLFTSWHWCALHQWGVTGVCMVVSCVSVCTHIMHFSFHSMKVFSRINLNQYIVFVYDLVSL